MFFGKKMKEMRLRYSNKGLHRFHESMNTCLEVSDLNDIEHGFIEPPKSERFIKDLKCAFGIDENNEDWKELIELLNSPFVMQKMPEGLVISPLAHKSDGSRLSEDEFLNLQKFINEKVNEHNKNADEFNKKQGNNV